MSVLEGVALRLMRENFLAGRITPGSHRYVSGYRDLSTKLRRRRQRQRQRQRQHQKSNKFYEQNNNSARASRFFVHFFAVPV